ncbi:hypothetical protein M404DRAFT_23293 [Pisolithus tinctorius Marx 270]|uniref:Uncharacterized protein n=1 Tax=Pisolithus tinctorius Marx 270 TaxID=870435 RepID=A0A0C3KEL2_PISTI|nr:hypothetical protein M404DRAFT_23293 [Pisolithus tinctorius Marx 270]
MAKGSTQKGMRMIGVMLCSHFLFLRTLTTHSAFATAAPPLLLPTPPSPPPALPSGASRCHPLHLQEHSAALQATVYAVGLVFFPDDDIRYNTDNEEEVMRVKAKERKRRKAAEQAQWEEQAQLEAERAVREQAEAERAAQERAEAKRAEREAKEKKVCEEEEKWEAERKCKARAGKGDEAGASGEARGEVKQVVMDPGCTHCTWAQVICEFVVDGNKKHMACVCCNLLKGKCRWPRDGKDTEAGPKARRTDKGKKQKAEEENAKAGPSNQKQARTSVRLTEVLDLNELEASGSRMKEAGVARYSGLENKLKQLIKAAGLIANNLASLFKLHETVSILDESYGFGMVVSPSDLGLSELDSDKLHKEAEWLKNHSEDEEESEGEDESMAKAK